MFNRNKKTIVFVLIVLISISSVSYFITKTESIEPLFALKARGLNSRHMDYLNLIKQHLARIGILLVIEYFNLSEVGFLGTLLAFRDFDLQIVEFPCYAFDNPFNPELYSENGSLNLAGYHTSMDWDDELGTGRNEWYIQTGSLMEPNNSQERINLSWEWQHYMMDEILPCLPLFTQRNNRSSYEILIFNMREVRPLIGSRQLCPEFPSKTKGLALRKAISYGINREEIRRVVLGDEYEIIHHPINPALEDWLNPNIFKFCYNKQVAGNYLFLPGWYLGTRNFGGYDRWPDWEDVCSNNPGTISVDGFSVELMSFCIALCSVIYFPFTLKRRKKEKGKK